MKKKQNTRRSLTDSVQKIYAEGMFVTAGFILGFDGEKGSIANPMADFIEEAAIPVSMVGLLCALPNTQLTRRLASEHRLFEGYDLHPDGAGDQCIRLNFETSRPRREILDDYCRVLSRIYDPAAFCARVERLIFTLNVRPAGEDHPADNFRRRHGIETVRRIVNRIPEYREVLWRTFLRCHAINPSADPQTVILLSFFLHLGPYARRIIAETKRAIAQIDAGHISNAGAQGDSVKAEQNCRSASAQFD